MTPRTLRSTAASPTQNSSITPRAEAPSQVSDTDEPVRTPASAPIQPVTCPNGLATRGVDTTDVQRPAARALGRRSPRRGIARTRDSGCPWTQVSRRGVALVVAAKPSLAPRIFPRRHGVRASVPFARPASDSEESSRHHQPQSESGAMSLLTRYSICSAPRCRCAEIATPANLGSIRDHTAPFTTFCANVHTANQSSWRHCAPSRARKNLRYRARWSRSKTARIALKPTISNSK